MTFEYAPRGVCSRRIVFEIDGDNKIHSVVFHGGCHGNTQGVAALIEGMDADEAIRRLSGIHCGMKPTSCPDQLSQALQAAKAQMNEQKS